MTPQTSVLRARWVFPVDRPPIENGVVEIADGRIIDIRPADRFSPLTGPEEQRAVIPGLVNAHTHLEFSELATPLPADSTFSEWIRSIVQYRRARTTPVPDIVQAGLAESAAAGVTTIGEIVTAGWTAAPFTPEMPRAVGFREAIALDPSFIAAINETVSRHLQDLTGHVSLIGGISPHAPYSVVPQLFHDLVDCARATKAPLAVHLAETHDELELLANGSGPLVDLFSESGFWRPDAIPRGTRPLDYLRLIETLPRALVIHGNYLTAEECDFLTGKPNLTVVYCPRTHAHFRHEPHPWLELQKRGVRVALGTDSRASNPDLSLWNEVLFLRSRFPQVAPAHLLELATRAGAAALGLDQRIGTLAPGKAADVTVLQLIDDNRSDPHERLLDPNTRPIGALRDGRWICSPAD